MTHSKLPMAKLPTGILDTDLDYPAYADNSYESFELWDVQNVGWVIPSLLISRAGRRQRATTPGVSDRYYAAGLDGKVWRVGRGPHVKRTVAVYVKKSRLTALQPFLTLRDKGSADANVIRDRISTRRARTALARSSWGF
jgi:hypothetical protein